MRLKKIQIIFLLSITFLLSIQTNAQVLGFKAGLSVSDLVGEIPTKSRFDVSAGFYADLDYNERLSFQVEALFNRQGATIKEDGQEIRLHYIAIPILVKYQLVGKINIYAGPQLSFLSIAQTYFKGNIFGIDDAISKADFGIVVGFAYEFPAGLSFDFRIHRGFIKAYKNTALNPLFKNQVLHISVGYLLVK